MQRGSKTCNNSKNTGPPGKIKNFLKYSLFFILSLSAWFSRTLFSTFYLQNIVLGVVNKNIWQTVLYSCQGFDGEVVSLKIRSVLRPGCSMVSVPAHTPGVAGGIQFQGTYLGWGFHPLGEYGMQPVNVSLSHGCFPLCLPPSHSLWKSMARKYPRVLNNTNNNDHHHLSTWKNLQSKKTTNCVAVFSTCSTVIHFTSCLKTHTCIWTHI